MANLSKSGLSAQPTPRPQDCLGSKAPGRSTASACCKCARARGALRDVFPDVLRGMPIAEEVMDTEKEINPAPARRQTGKQAAEAAKQQADAEVDADARAELVARLEKIAEEEGESHTPTHSRISENRVG